MTDSQAPIAIKAFTNQGVVLFWEVVLNVSAIGAF
jgi:hypothetical protein